MIEVLISAKWVSENNDCCAETCSDDGCSCMDTSAGTCYTD